ncbi:hypothetical protein BDEG_20546 [Batrachochytrium dendrobatidis JEL423]|uniref:WD40 repeat-containing protein SMU1 n=1 Tax=Batrachochytrium dendrobatidis (strain JEL423) TaxID=403673 RepID=A0A177W8D7_BATDL|nr:hypothetical protein BDEG_20546 [Batrachochytrium dendrobatidis JEL423]
MSLEIEAAEYAFLSILSIAVSISYSFLSVIRLVQQFLKENNLLRSLAVLQEETNISLNTVDNAEAFKADILHGRWDAVLKTLSTIAVPAKKLIDLYEQIVLELIELRELVAARSLLRQTDPMHVLKEIYPDRYLHLETLLGKSHVSSSEMYPNGVTKEKRRKAVSQSLDAEIAVVAPSRLLALLGQSIKWQTLQGMIQPDAAFDLFKGVSPAAHAEDDTPPSIAVSTIKFPKKQYAEVATFSPNGNYFVTGTIDGLIEVWNYITGKLRKDLPYQAAGNIMLMESAVLSLTFSRDSELLASGSQDGKIKIWKVHTGQCIKRFPLAHSQGITSLYFNNDSTQLLSASFDGVVKLSGCVLCDAFVKIHGLKSGKTLREFRGHASFVNRAVFSTDMSRVISGSSDGTVKIWDAKSADCLVTLALHNGKLAPLGVQSCTVTSILLTPKDPDHIIVSNESSIVYMISIKGKIIKTMKLEAETPTDFITAAVSQNGEFVYCAGEDGKIYAFGTEGAALVSHFEVGDFDSMPIIRLKLH